MNQKSKGVAYLLWFFFGVLGVHKFYVGKAGMGVLYLFTGALFGIGWFIDLFTLGNQVDIANALQGARAGNNGQNIVVNVANTSSPAGPMAAIKTSAEKQILQLAENSPQLSLKDIVSRTELEMDEAETALRRMAEKGLIKEILDPAGKTLYDAS
jgi:TM2 domain-containing membrane protein YozV